MLTLSPTWPRSWWRPRTLEIGLSEWPLHVTEEWDRCFPTFKSNFLRWKYLSLLFSVFFFPEDSRVYQSPDLGQEIISFSRLTDRGFINNSDTHESYHVSYQFLVFFFYKTGTTFPFFYRRGHVVSTIFVNYYNVYCVHTTFIDENPCQICLHWDTNRFTLTN